MKDRPNTFAVFLGLAQVFAWASTYYLPANISGVVASDLGATDAAVIGGFSVAILVGGVLAPMIGRRTQLKGGRDLLIQGSLLCGTGLLLLSQAQNLVHWYLGWVVVGVGMALSLFNVVFSLLVQMYGHGAKDLVLKVTLVSGFATLFFPVTTFLLRMVGWRTALIVYALPYLLILAPLYFFLVPRVVTADGAAKEASAGFEAKKGGIAFFALLIFAVLRTLIGTAVSVHILNVFQNLELSSESAAMAAAFIGPSQSAGRLLEFLFGRRFSAIQSSVFWAAVLPGAFVALMFVGAPAGIPFAVAYGMSNGMATINMNVLLMTYFNIHQYPSVVAKIAMPNLIIQAASPLLATAVIGSMAIHEVLLMACGLGLIAVVCLLVVAWRGVMVSESVPSEAAK